MKAEKADCVEAHGVAVWSNIAPEQGECIKYWAAGLTDNTSRVIVFLHGDVMAGRHVFENYTKLTGDALSRHVTEWHRRTNAPFIFLGRPGTHGSSGEHMRRRTLDEAKILNGALGALKNRYGIREFVLAGQSGGGHMVSSLLTLRSDIICAIPASSPNSPRVRFEMMGRSVDTTGFDSFEPVEHLSQNPIHPSLRVFILGDPLDSNVFWNSQIALAPALASRNVQHRVIEGVAIGGSRHSLNSSARTLAGLCYHNESTDFISTYLQKYNVRG